MDVKMSTQNPPEPLRAGLNHPAYNTPMRVRGWTRRLKAKNSPTTLPAKQIIKKLAPHWSQADHALLAKYHTDRAAKLDAIWCLVSERAALQDLGRPWQFTDYEICAIAREEFAPRHKRVLRHCAYRGTEHKTLALAHAAAAGRAAILALSTI